jgi:hypothetical protein
MGLGFAPSVRPGQSGMAAGCRRARNGIPAKALFGLKLNRPVAENHHPRARRNFLKPFCDSHDWTYLQHTREEVWSWSCIALNSLKILVALLDAINGIRSFVVGASHKAVGVGTMPDLRKHFSTACSPSKHLSLTSLPRKPRLKVCRPHGSKIVSG